MIYWLKGLPKLVYLWHYIYLFTSKNFPALVYLMDLTLTCCICLALSMPEASVIVLALTTISEPLSNNQIVFLFCSENESLIWFTERPSFIIFLEIIMQSLFFSFCSRKSMKMIGTTKVWRHCAWTIHIRDLAIPCCSIKCKGHRSAVPKWFVQ